MLVAPAHVALPVPIPVASHAPPEQNIPPEHAWPHEPQLLGSNEVFVHAPLHTTSGAAHDALHTLAEHTVPAPHACPHAPQL
jgi:hypothetical protein